MYKFTGDGSEFLNHVPARDLTDKEFAALSEEDQARVRASKLYKEVKERSVRPAQEVADGR